MGKPLRLKCGVERITRYRGIGVHSPYLDADYCHRCGWIPKEKVVQDRSGALCCPRCGQRVRTRPRSRYKPERMREWRRTN